MVDASIIHVGAVLQHFRCSSWAPLSLISKKLALTPPSETRYSAFDMELLVIYAAICHFRLLLEGREFLLLTNPSPSLTPWAGFLRLVCLSTAAPGLCL